GSVIGNKIGAKIPHPLVALDVLAVNIEGFADKLLSDLVDRGPFATAVLERPSHAFDCPEQIHSGRPSYQEPFANSIKGSIELLQRALISVLHPQRDTHRGGNTNSGRASHDHVLYCYGHFVVSLEYWIKFVGGKPSLIDHYDAVVGPLNCSNHGRKDDSE